MQNFMSKMEKSLAPIAEKIGANRLLKTISSAFNMIMPIVIIGAIFSLLTTIQIGPYQDFIISTGINKYLGLVSQFTTNMLAVYVTFTAAYSFVKNEGMTGDALQAGLLSILSYFIMSPLADVVVGETTTTYIPFDFLGSKGLFSALIIGILVGYIYRFIVAKGWIIKMPEGVPPTISKSFSALLPGIIIVLIFTTINGLFMSLLGVSFSQWIYDILAIPLSSLSGSLPAYCLLLFIGQVFWFLGIHGAQVISPFLMILFMEASLENQSAFASGNPMTNILTFTLVMYLSLGGTGQTIGLAIDMFFFSKSNRYKTLGKVSFLPSLCNINEPIVFGFPLILNPITAIPFFCLPVASLIITYFLMDFGLVGLTRIAMGAAGTPLLFDGFMYCGISGMIWQIILIIISTIVYYPFFKIQDNLALKEEKAGVE